MNPADTQRFDDAYKKYEVGNYSQALQDLRELAKDISNPWEKAEVHAHEVIFLLELDEITAARLRVDELNKMVRSLISEPVDGYEYDLEISLPVMARYLEIRVAAAEGRAYEALRQLDELVPRYPQQLSIPEFRDISRQLRTLRGFLLGDLGKWKDAEPLLESASPPDKWRSTHCYYLGRCEFELKKYRKAKEKFREAINLGLESPLENQAHYALGITEYYLSDMRAAKYQFEFCGKAADKRGIDMARLWEWLESTSMALGQLGEAENYHKLMIDSLPKKVN
jgi:tetratricopeptide (TPR) repeat protein